MEDGQAKLFFTLVCNALKQMCFTMLNYSDNLPGALAALAEADGVAERALQKLKASFEAAQAALQSDIPSMKRLGKRSMWPDPRLPGTGNLQSLLCVGSSSPRKGGFCPCVAVEPACA